MRHNPARFMKSFTAIFFAMLLLCHAAPENPSIVPETPAPRATTSPVPLPPKAQEALEIALRFHMKGEWKRAEVGYLKVLQLASDAREVHYHLAVCFYNQKELAKAKSHLQIALSRGESLAEANNLLGVIAGSEDRKEEALKFFMEAMKLNPASDQFPYNASEELRKLGMTEQAIPYLQKAIALKPQEPLYSFKLRMARISASHAESVDKEVREQLAAESPTGDWLLLAAALELQKGRAEQAGEFILRAKEAMSPPIFFGMLQDTFFLAHRENKEIQPFYEVQISEASGGGKVIEKNPPASVPDSSPSPTDPLPLPPSIP